MLVMMPSNDRGIPLEKNVAPARAEHCFSDLVERQQGRVVGHVERKPEQIAHAVMSITRKKRRARRLTVFDAGRVNRHRSESDTGVARTDE